MSKRDSRSKGLIVREEKETARGRLNAMKPFELKQDLYLIHGWGDEANICWTHPYTETGKNMKKDWKYTFQDWAKVKITNHDERVHYLKLVDNENNIDISNKKGKLKVSLEKNGQRDKTYYFISFFQFAELLKEKISGNKNTKQINLLCHSMGGLDAVTAIGANPEDDDSDAIVSTCLDCVNKLITVATPHRGSPAADLANTKISKLIMGNTDYTALQGKNMCPNESFIKTVNDLKIRKRVMDRISELHIFGGSADIVVPSPYYKFDTKGLSNDARGKIMEYKSFQLAAHSQVGGITQDPRLLCKLFEILSK